MTRASNRNKILSKSSRKGSVLMEFVVVLPLYCALLGGMFFVGELMVNRIRLHVGDQVGTVMAATRLFQVSSDSEDDPIVTTLGKYVFGDTLELAGEITVGRDPKSLNGFMAMWAGGVKRLDVSAPDWMRGMLYMHESFNGSDMEDLKTKRVYSYLPGEDYRRSVSFHRNSAWSEALNRSATSGEVVCYGILVNVLSDNWILSESEAKISAIDADTRANGVSVVSRCLSQWGE